MMTAEEELAKIDELLARAGFTGENPFVPGRRMVLHLRLSDALIQLDVTRKVLKDTMLELRKLQHEQAMAGLAEWERQRDQPRRSGYD